MPDISGRYFRFDSKLLTSNALKYSQKWVWIIRTNNSVIMIPTPSHIQIESKLVPRPLTHVSVLF